MRVTVDRDDPDFIGVENAGRYKVTVDGREIPKPLEADDEAGICVALALDENGRLCLNEAKTDVVTVEHRGMVRIIDTRAAA